MAVSPELSCDELWLVGYEVLYKISECLVVGYFCSPYFDLPNEI